mgnify:CR=1 FL=1
MAWLFAGHMADVYGTFDPSFYLASACCMLAVVIFCFIPCLRKKYDRQNVDQGAVEQSSDDNDQAILHESTV